MGEVFLNVLSSTGALELVVAGFIFLYVGSRIARASWETEFAELIRMIIASTIVFMGLVMFFGVMLRLFSEPQRNKPHIEKQQIEPAQTNTLHQRDVPGNQ